MSDTLVLIKMQTFGDWESQYEPIFVTREDRAKKICEVLNDLCKSHPGNEKDITMLVALTNESDKLALVGRMVKECDIPATLAINIVSKVIEMCHSYTVYIYGDNFAYEYIEMI